MRRSPRWFAAWAIAAALVLLAAASLTAPYCSLRETIWDWATRRTAAAPSTVTVVDIDRASLMELGPWPWPRSTLARLMSAVAAASPRVIALDIVLEGADERSPAGLARRLSAASPDVAAALKNVPLEDGDGLLAAATRQAPAVFGIALDSGREGVRLPGVPLLSHTRPEFEKFWTARGGIGPAEALLGAAAGAGVVALPGDPDGRIRRVPLLVRIAARPQAGLAAETVRVAGKASSYILSASPAALGIGEAKVRFAPDAMLRLRPTSPSAHAGRTVTARDLVAGRVPHARLQDRIVLIGSSAPEAGGLRTAAFGELVPSVQLQSDAVEQILSGDSPWRLKLLPILEATIALAVCAAAAWMGFKLPPNKGGMITAAILLIWSALCFLAARSAGLLVDPLLPLGAGLLAQPAAAFAAATELRRREQAIRERFEQHLAPEVVRRLAEQPDLMRLEGEAREITAMFTDIEGFTDLTERCDPRTLVALLDRYFEGTVRIVIEHGGMIEKIVGDALHVLFNAPLDLEHHPHRAVACASAVVAFGESFRAETQPKALRFGRTRVGIETGAVVVGNVGGGRRLDYTAHGRAMNLAARLEAANKELGSSICIGPAAAARLDAASLRSLGEIALRGFAGGIAVGEPWPSGYDAEDRRMFAAAMQQLKSAPRLARADLSALAAKHPNDGVVARLLQQLPASEAVEA